MNITVLYNKPAERFTKKSEYVEAEADTESSAREVYGALIKKGADARLVPITEKTIPHIIDSIQKDLVFNLIEWTGVDTSYVIETFDLLDANRVLYTGATKKSYLDSCDKTRIKKMVQSIGLPTPKWQTFVSGNETVQSNLSYPMIVKVSLEHSSVGIGLDSIVKNSENLLRVVKKRIATYHQPVFAETFLPGREFQVTILQKKDGLVVLPPAEIVYTKNTTVPILTYESRWNEEHNDYDTSKVTLAILSSKLKNALVSMSTQAFEHLGFRDYARFDIRCDEKENPYFLELNSNPGLGDDEEYGMTISYKAAGMTFADVVWGIVKSTLRRSMG